MYPFARRPKRTPCDPGGPVSRYTHARPVEFHVLQNLLGLTLSECVARGLGEACSVQPDPDRQKLTVRDAGGGFLADYVLAPAPVRPLPDLHALVHDLMREIDPLPQIHTYKHDIDKAKKRLLDAIDEAFAYKAALTSREDTHHDRDEWTPKTPGDAAGPSPQG